MKTFLHKANTRGHAHHGWLDTNHTFSFANYYHPDRMHFGALRVLNDDWVNPGMGFGQHPHNNMEIISIPLEGDLEHKDSMGNSTVIKQNDVQVMSAGTGVEHSEYNKNKDRKVNFLQLWIFPKVKNIAPRYSQKTFDPAERVNKFQQVAGPDGVGVIINQDAWLHRAGLVQGVSLDYTFKRRGNGLYVFVIDGEVSAAEEKLNKRDGLGITEVDELTFYTDSHVELLLIEVPMTF